MLRRTWTTFVRCASAAALATAATACSRAEPVAPVVVAVPYGPADLWSHTSADEITNSILRNAYEPLVDLSASLRVVPCLASSWSNPDDLTWEFQLRRDLVLHDGRKLLADQVAEFLQRTLQDPSTIRSPGHLIESAKASDPYTLVLRTRRPVGWLPSQLARLLIAVPAQDGSPVPVGTGPYRIVRWQPKGDIELEAFATYREGEPRVRRLQFAAIPDSAEAVRRLRAHEIDLLPDPPAESWAALRADPDLHTLEQPSLRVVFLGIDTLPGSKGNPALRDVRVRRALRLALDPAALIETALPGAGMVANELVPPELVGAHGQLPREPRDLARARELLSQAGVQPGLHLRLDFESARYPGIERIAATLAGQLSLIGLQVELRPRAPQSRLQAAEVDLFLLGWLHSSGDAAASYEYLVHTPGGQGRGGLSADSNPEVDRLLAEAARPVAGGERQKLLRSVAQIIHDDVALIPLYRTADRYALARRLTFFPRLDRRIRGQDLGLVPR